jgi:hypothetical protein
LCLYSFACSTSLIRSSRVEAVRAILMHKVAECGWANYPLIGGLHLTQRGRVARGT